MHDFLHALMDEYDRDIKEICRQGKGWDLEAFMAYWLSGLFVVVEGFNKLNLKDASVQKLFKEHLRHLKAMRHETYHFTIEKGVGVDALFKELNWAEDLHDAIGEYLREHVLKKAADEKREERAAKRKAKRKKS